MEQSETKQNGTKKNCPNVKKAVLLYAAEPTEEQLARLTEFLKGKLGCSAVELEMKEDPGLISGFVLRADSREYDFSARGQLRQLKQKLFASSDGKKVRSAKDIIPMFRERIKEFQGETQTRQEVGFVTWAGDGIAIIDGIRHAMYGEILQFDNGVKAMVQDVRTDETGCILFGRDDEIREGSRVARTGKMAGIPVGDAFIGRIVDALGAPIDGRGEIESGEYRPIEHEAPGIVDRKSVSVPLETGILSIDSMFPIGRGQRELIIGDRQTGKTSIAVDTILNQKGKDVICVYVAIGQKASTVAKIVNTLKSHDAMDYTIILSATASDPAPLQYVTICPSMRWHTGPFPCCWNVPRAERRIREMYFTCIPGF